MSLPPIDDVAALHDRMDAAERQAEVWAQHHHTLAQQIAELTVTIRSMAAKNAEIQTALLSMSAKSAEIQTALLDMERRIPTLMAEGILAAVGDPQTWQAGREAMRRQAQQAAGGWLLGGVRFILDKLLWAGVALLAIYMLGGWPAIAAALKVKGTTP